MYQSFPQADIPVWEIKPRFVPKAVVNAKRTR
jgi:hypothetical protein